MKVLIAWSFFSILLLSVSAFDTKSFDMEERMDKLENGLQSLTQEVSTIVSLMEEMKLEIKSFDERTNLKEEPNSGMSNHNKADTPMNDTTIEERVTILEFQVSELDEEVTNIEDRTTVVEGEVAVIFAEQVLQDERILALELDSDSFEDAIVTLEETVASVDNKLTAVNYTLSEEVLKLDAELTQLGDTVAETDGRVENAEAELLTVTEMITEIDDRVAQMEVTGTVAFQVDLNQYTSIPIDSIVVFDEVTLNIGNGYDNATGQFTVPPGGDGLYFFYVSFFVQDQEAAGFYIRLGDGGFCRAEADMDNIGVNDKTTASNGCIILLTEGNVVSVYYDTGTDDTPVVSNGLNANMFTGFRIAPE